MRRIPASRPARRGWAAGVLTLGASFLLWAAGALADPGGVGSASDELSWLLERHVEEGGQTAGVAAAVLTPDGVEVATAGRAKGAAPPTTETLFEIGSITKVFTALLLADLVREGRVAPGTPIGDLVPSADDGGPRLDPEVASITLEELATHTSGLPRLPGGLALAPFVLRPSDPYRGSTREDLMAALEGLDGSDLGSRGRWAYSNLGSAVLGRLLEEAGGAAWEDLVQERILEPLGMSRTFVGVPPEHAAAAARGHRENLRPARPWQFDAYAPAGGIVSTLDDMVRFVAAAMAAGSGIAPGAEGVERAEGRRDGLARSLSLAARTAWAAEPDATSGPDAMGLGWILREVDGEWARLHNGRTGGFHAWAGYLPDTGRGVVVLSNTSHWGDPFALGLLRGEPVVEPPSAGWFPLGTTAFLLLAAPLLAWVPVRRLRAARKVPASVEDRPAGGRIHFLDGLLTATACLALAWTVGAWQVLPGWLWWGAALASVAVLLPAVRPALGARWWGPGGANVGALASVVLMLAGLVWVVGFL